MVVGKYCGLHLDEIYVLADVTPDKIVLNLQMM